jgi:hypothetical protein
MLAGIRFSPLYFPQPSLAMTAVLRHVKGSPLLRLLPPLRHAITTSVAADPILLSLPSKIDDRASDVHIVVRIAVDLRRLLYARQAQTQCPRRWLMASTPVARAVWPIKKAVSSPASKTITQRLTPSPPVNRMSKVRTLQTKISRVAIVNPRLEASCRSGVPTFCPVFSGLQTG